MRVCFSSLLAAALLLPTFAGGIEDYFQAPDQCDTMSVFDYGMWMCMPLSMEGMPMKMAMLHGQIIAGGDSGSGPRGRNALFSTNMIMGDLGKSLGANHYVNLDLMATAERWTLPYAGYPELLQIGESNSSGQRFIDAQHPHSSPIMGLTLSDTMRFSAGSQNSLRFFFAPRGESTDGPVAFMHRPTAIYNPDAPLGHHIGQDVGHISSTVIGASLAIEGTRIEASAFNGTEPEPDSVDLPLGTPNSVAMRITQQFSPKLAVMASAAYVSSPEPDNPALPFVARYSASAYYRTSLSSEWNFHNSLVYGLITKYDNASALNSLLEEFLFTSSRPRIWGRLELVQRTPAELEVSATGDPNQGLWVGAVTLGYSHRLADIAEFELDLGASATLDVLPDEFVGSYGGNPWSGRIFLRLGGTSMWNL